MLCSFRLQNFGPFDEVSISFGKMNCITGENGVGKSALLEALRWCMGGSALRGDGKRGREDELIRIGQKSMMVQLEWMGDDGVWTVTRSRRLGKASILTMVSGSEVLNGKTAQAEIWNRIGVDSTGWNEIVQVSQGRVSSIADAGDGKRREILLSWLGNRISDWDSGRARIVKRKRAARQSVVRIRSHIDVYTRQITDLQGRASLDDGQENMNEIGSEIQTLQGQLSKNDGNERLNKKRIHEIVDLESQLSELAIPTQSLELVPDDPSEQKAGLESQKSILRSERRAVQRVKTGWDSNCPLVGIPCPSQKWVETEGDERDALIKDLDSRLIPVERVLEEIHHKEGIRNLAIKRNRDREKLASRTRERIEDFRERIIGLQSVDIHPVMALDEKLAIRTRILELVELRDLMIRRGEQQTELKRLESIVATEKGTLERDETELMICTEILAAIDQTTGPAALAHARIESGVNQSLQSVGWNFSLNWTKPTNKRVSECGCGEVIRTNRVRCPACGEERELINSPDLSLILDDGRTVRDIRHGSGGQRQIVSLALRLATCPVDFIILDEVDSATTGDLKSRLARMISDSSLQTIVISHGLEIPALSEQVFTVVSNGQLSEVANG